MKALLIFLLVLFSQITHAAESPVPQKIIPIVLEKGMSVWQVYNENKDYKTSYKAINSFAVQFCANNPEHFKKLGCTEKAYKILRAGKSYFFPTLPETKSGKSIKWVYNHNKVYRSLFPVFAKFQQEICKNNTQPCTTKVLNTTKTNPGLKISVLLPQTYLIQGENSDVVTVNKEKTYTKSKNGGYYILTQNTNDKTFAIKVASDTEKLVQQNSNQADMHQTVPSSYIATLSELKKNNNEVKKKDRDKSSGQKK
jgi:uncharacterized protein YpmB